jgi:quercetin dioxygenase-like cupin family protein
MGRVLLAAAAAAAAFLAAPAAHAQMNSSDLKWGAAPPGLPAGAQLAVLSGDPGKQGMFTIRLMFPANYAVPPHHHPSDELVTVIDGTLSLGMGETLDKAKAATLVQGGYVVAPAGMNHYAFTGGKPVTIQITAHGPFEIAYVNAADDPRNAKTAERGR